MLACDYHIVSSSLLTVLVVIMLVCDYHIVSSSLLTVLVVISIYYVSL